jgi:hypothetical protein
LNRVNRLLCEKSLPFQFVTLFLFLLNPDGAGQFISAGHNPAYLFRSATGKIEELAPTPFSWGCSISPLINPARSISTKETFWWCIPTAYGRGKPAGEMFGEERLLEIIRQERPLGKSRGRAELLKAIEDFTQGMPQTDDITFVVVEKSHARLPLQAPDSPWRESRRSRPIPLRAASRRVRCGAVPLRLQAMLCDRRSSATAKR